MPLHPQAQAMIDAHAAGPALDYATLTAAAFRAAFDIPTPSAIGGGRVPTVTVEDREVELCGARRRVRLYYPDAPGPLAMTLYLHGGGFVIGSPETTDGICRTLARGAGSLVISPDYRLAPEAPFPAGLDDAYATLCWAHDHAAALGGIASKIAVAGDSSGGNFAASLALTSRAIGPRLCHQLLLYPVLDCRFDTASYRALATGYFLTAELMRWFWRQYLPDARLAADPRASPLRAPELAGAPSATIVTAEYDVVRDEAEAYASRLRAAGVAVELMRWQGQVHGFLLCQGTIDDADVALQEAAERLRCALARG